MNRREVLSGMAVAGASVAMSAPTIANTLPTSRAAWDKAMAAYQQARAASDASDAEFERIDAAYRVAIDKVPHVMSGDMGCDYPMSTADSGEVRRIRSSLASVRYIEPCTYADHNARQALIDAACRQARCSNCRDRRKCRLFRDRPAMRRDGQSPWRG